MVLAVLVSIVCVLLCVAVHLGFLLLLYWLASPRFRGLRRAAVGVIVLVAILGHVLEITLFWIGYALLAPPDDGSAFDVWYHSAAAYTSLGDSQLGSTGWRLMTAVEALTGLILITWTASFTFLVMQKNWRHREPVSLSLKGVSRGLARPDEPAGVVAERS